MTAAMRPPFLHRPRSFRNRIFVYCSGALAGVSLLLTLLLLQGQRRLLQEQILGSGLTLARLLADNARVAVFSENEEALRSLAVAALCEKDVVEVAVFGGDGRLLAAEAVSRDDPVFGARAVVSRVPEAVQRLARQTHEEGSRSITFWAPVLAGRLPSNPDSLYFLDTEAAAASAEAIGFVSVSLTKEPLRQALKTVVFRSLAAAVVLLACGVGVTFLVVREATRPLGRLLEALRERGATVAPGDDIGGLSDTFGQLVTRLDAAFASIAELKSGLEVTVQARTAELRAARDHLEQRVRERTVELEQTHQQLLHAEKLSTIGRIAASIAHEFNNPICGIRNVLKGVGQRDELPADDRELVVMAIGECDRIAALIRDLQGFNRPSSGRPGPTNLHKAIDSILLLCRKDLSSKKARLERAYAPDLPAAWAVEDQIKQVILNLLTNAMDALPEAGGIVRVETEHACGQVVLRISDTGVGIPKEDLGRIFEPFYTSKPETQGTGLGLGISQTIVKRHGGTIEVESELGKGTTVTVRLPVAGTR